MRFALVSCLALAAAPALADATGPGGLAGVWTVTSTLTPRGSCTHDAPAAERHDWFVSVARDGTVTASVQGQTVFPLLRGGLEDGRLRLSGFTLKPEAAGVLGQSTFVLDVEAGRLVGSRVDAATEDYPVQGAEPVRVGCARVFEVVATR